MQREHTFIGFNRALVVAMAAIVFAAAIAFADPSSIAAQTPTGIGAQPQSNTTPGATSAASVATATRAVGTASVATATRPASTGGGMVAAATVRPATVPAAMPRSGAGGTATSYVNEGAATRASWMLLAGGVLVAGAAGAGALRRRVR